MQIGAGASISSFLTTALNVRIGWRPGANPYSYVELNRRLSDFVTFGPGVKINGKIVIVHDVDSVYGAVVCQVISIEADAVVAMGALITQNVAKEL